MFDIFNAVWRSLRVRKPTKKKRNFIWSLIKYLIQISVMVWKILKYFFDEGSAP